MEGKTVPDATGKFVNVHAFDNSVFHVNKKMADSTEPAIKGVLEPSFEAIVDAGKLHLTRGKIAIRRGRRRL